MLLCGSVEENPGWRCAGCVGLLATPVQRRAAHASCRLGYRYDRPTEMSWNRYGLGKGCRRSRAVTAFPVRSRCGLLRPRPSEDGSGDVSMTKKSSRVLGLLATCVFALEACGDGEEGKEGPPNCARMCRVYAAAGCDEFDEDECIESCSESAAWGRACATEYQSIIRCVVRAPAASVVCADGQPAVTGTDCAQEFYEHAMCTRLSGGEAGVGGAAGHSGTGGRTSAVLCGEACPYSGDGVCDDGGPGASFGDCSYGTDCADCGIRVWTAPGEPICSNDCDFRADGRCDDGGPGAQSGVCTYGTDCADCGARAAPGVGGGGTGGSDPTELCTDQCSFSADGLCDDGGLGADYSVCELGTDCTDCGPRTVGGEVGMGGSGFGGSGTGAAGGSGGAVQNQLCSEECPHAGDGVCNDGGPGASHWDCTYGTDCSDCGVRGWTADGEPVCSNDCVDRGNDECDDGGPGALNDTCAYGTDCVDCGARVAGTGGTGGTGGVGGSSGAGQSELCSEQCVRSGDGVCDDGGPRASYEDCDYGTDCSDCGVRVWAGVGEPLCSNDCIYPADGECDDGGPGAVFSLCELGTDCIDCGARDSVAEGVGGSGGGASVPLEWTCAAGFYGSSDGCDCGCGVTDPDCAGFGCTVAGCSASGCQFCHAADGTSELCD